MDFDDSFEVLLLFASIGYVVWYILSSIFEDSDDDFWGTPS